MAELKVESLDDRSGEVKPGPKSFGFVYFSDGARVGYAPSLSDRPPVWHGGNESGRWTETTEKHLTLAREYLTEQGVLSGSD